MKTIYLLRHADASPSFELEDIDRPLSDKGLQDAERLGKIMVRERYVPQTILCSSATRTRQTLELLSFKDPVVEYSEKLYLGTAGDYIHALQNLPETYNNVLLIGHNPSIHEAVKFLCQYRDDVRLLSYSPCTFTALSSNIDTWKAIKPAKASLLDIITT